MQLRSLLGAVSLVCLPLAAACGGSEDKSEADIREGLSASLQRNADDDIDAETADCYADAIIDELGVEAIRDVDLSDEAPRGEFAQDITDAASTADATCQPSASGG